MKKIILFLLVISLPTIVNARFGGVYGSNICIDANNVNPAYWDPSCQANTSLITPGGNFNNALLAIGALWQQTGDIASAADAYRVFVARSGQVLETVPWQPDGYKDNTALLNDVREGYGISATASQMVSAAEAMYNGFGDMSLLNAFSSDNSQVRVTSSWTEIPSKEWTDSTKYYSKKLLLNLNISSGNPNAVKVTGCSLDSKSASAGFKVRCDNKVNITSGGATQEVIIYTDGLVYNDANNVKVTVNYTIEKNSSALYLHTYGGIGCVPEHFRIPALNYGQGYAYSLQRFVSLGTNNQSRNESTSYSLVVTKTCQYNDEDGSPHYYFHITHPGETNEDIQEISVLEYMRKGCCDDVKPKYFNNNSFEGREAIKLYKEKCMTKDLVSFENSCHKNFKYNKETQKCEEEVEIKLPDDDYSYSKSFIWQVPMKTIKDKFLKNTSFENINNDNETLRYYYDENLSNKYCKVLTSEDNEIYFPTTAVATSGRFFVFQELDTNKCNLTGLNYNSKNCFRQPYVKGTIHLYVVNNYSAWLSDYNAAVSERNNYCSGVAIDEKEGLSNNVKCNEAINRVRDLENAKNTCENNVNNFNYDLEPTLTFSYEQDSPNQGLITEEISMYATKDTDQPVKYWPNVSSKTEIYTNSENSIGKYSFSSNNSYQTAYTKTVYYRPSINSFSLLPSGAIHEQKYETSANVFENGIDVGYVYNVNITTYEGVYNTWFNISNLGNGKENSKLNQMVVSEYKDAQNLNNLKSTCTYCNEEGSFSRECPTCEELDANFIFRNISLQNVVPNEREYNTNWVDEKGNAAAFMIEQNSGNRLALNDKANNQIKLVAMETSTNNDQMIADIYNDPSQEYLEYDITLTANDIKTIKANNRKYDYAEIKMCDNNSRNDTKSEDAQYCYVCNKDGKECESTFIDAYSNMSVTTESRKNKWKYFFYVISCFQIISPKP